MYPYLFIVSTRMDHDDGDWAGLLPTLLSYSRTHPALSLKTYQLVTSFVQTAEQPEHTHKRRRKRRDSFLQSSAISTSSSASAYKRPVVKKPRRNSGIKAKQRLARHINRVEQAKKNHSRLLHHCFHELADDFDWLDLAAQGSFYHSKTKSQQRKWIMDQCLSRKKGRKGFSVIYKEQHISCCNSCFATFHGFGKSTLQRTQRLVSEGQKHIPDEEKMVSPSQMFMETKTWIKQIYLAHGDYMPDELTVCLPVYTRVELFRWYKSASQCSAHYKYPSFTELLKDEFPFITFRRHKKFMKCKKCRFLDLKIAKAPVTSSSYFLLFFSYNSTRTILLVQFYSYNSTRTILLHRIISTTPNPHQHKAKIHEF